MIGAPGLLSLHQYLFILLAAIVILVFLGIFIPNLYKRLSVRIMALIFLSGPATVVITRILDEFFFRVRLRIPLRLHLLETVLIVLGGPVVLGLLAAGYMRRPLRQFNNAMASLEHSNYKVQLLPTGIHEFDEVFTQFNNLIHRLEHEEKLRKNLVSDTSHELNTPLTIVIGQLTAIQEGKLSLSKKRVAAIQEQAERLSALVQQLDAYTKARMPDHGEPQEIDVKGLCEELINHFGLELKQKEITAKLHIAEGCTLREDRSALQQILTNLLQNTLRYSEATELIISADEHQLTFSDNGKGVPSDSLQYLFERFYRVDKSRNRTAGGLGLGLAIVRELAEQQGWHIHAEHGNPGITFVLNFEQQR